MMPADQTELITAAVDGTLSATELRAFRKLLEASAEARALYAKLKSDRDRVRALPRVAPPADLQAKILAKIAAATPVPVVPVTPARPRRYVEPNRRRTSLWAPIAAAACLLFGVTAISFAYFNHQSKATAAAKNPYADALPATQDSPVAVPSPATAPIAIPSPDAAARLDVSPVPPIAHPRPAPEAIAIAPEPRPVVPNFFAARPLPPIPPLDFIKVRVPFLRTVAEFDRDDTRQELTDELGRDVPFRLDLFVRDTARGAEVFQNAAKAAGLTVYVDATTLDRLKKKQVTSVAVYTESLTAAELTDLFAKLSAEDTKYSPRVCDSLHVTPVIGSDEKELKQLLGVDVGLFKRVSGAGYGERGDKPVSANTIESVSKSLNGTAPKSGDPTAVLLTWHPTTGRTNPMQSKEVAQYKEKRGPRKPNAVPAIIVIRLVG